jgi:DNA mismatch repair protein MutS2
MNGRAIGKSNSNIRSRSTAKAADKLIAAEQAARNVERSTVTAERKADTKVAMRTQSNTVDVRGCNLEEAKEKAKNKFSQCLMSGRPVVFILHGHGTGGVLRNKVRSWLQSERQLVKSFGPADVSDGGDAFTRVELR